MVHILPINVDLQVPADPDPRRWFPLPPCGLIDHRWLTRANFRPSTVFLVAMRNLSSGGVAAVQQDTVAQTQLLSGLDRVRTIQGEGGTRPAVVTTVPAGRMVDVLGVVEDGDAAPFPRRHRTGLIEPAGALEVRL